MWLLIAAPRPYQFPWWTDLYLHYNQNIICITKVLLVTAAINVSLMMVNKQWILKLGVSWWFVIFADYQNYITKHMQWTHICEKDWSQTYRNFLPKPGEKKKDFWVRPWYCLKIILDPWIEQVWNDKSTFLSLATVTLRLREQGISLYPTWTLTQFCIFTVNDQIHSVMNSSNIWRVPIRWLTSNSPWKEIYSHHWIIMPIEHNS